MKGLTLIVLVILIAVSTSGNLINDVVSRGVLKVGQGSGYMPLHGMDENGNFIGLEIDLLKKMAVFLGVKLEIVVINWDGIIPGLLSGKFDMICSGMTINPERALKVDFSIPYLTVGQTLIYNNSCYTVPPEFEDIKDSELKISVQLGTTGNIAASRLFKNAEILTFETIDEAALQVASNKVDIMIHDSIYANYISRKYRQLERTDRLFTIEKLGIAIRKGELESLRWIDTFIEWLETTGEMASLEEKWFEQYTPE